MEPLDPKKLGTERSREWILRCRVHNNGPTETFEAKANFVVDGDATGSSPWYTGWGTHPERAVKIANGDYEDLNVAVVVEPGSVSEPWRVHGLKPPHESVGYRDDPFSRDVGFSLLVTPAIGNDSYPFGVRIKIKDQKPWAVRDDSIVPRPRLSASALPDPGRTNSEFRGALQAALADGLALKKRMSPTPLGSRLMVLQFMPATAAEIERWKSHVRRLLSECNDPMLLAEFDAPDPEPLYHGTLAAVASVMQNPEYVEMERNLKTLARVIRELPR